MDWVEDGLLAVMEAMLTDEVRTAQLLARRYPEGVDLKGADILDTPQTLHCRLCCLLRCLKVVGERLAEFTAEDAASLLAVFDVFGSCVRMAYGADVADELAAFVRAFAQLWSCDAAVQTGGEALQAEVDRLVDLEGDALASLERAARERQSMRTNDSVAVIHDAIETVGEAIETVGEKVDTLSEKVDEGSVLQKRNIRLYNRAMAYVKPEGDDEYSRYAGLDKIVGACREEVLACIRYSHDHPFEVVRDAHDGQFSLQHLANEVWALNHKRYEEYATRPTDRGYKDARSLAAKLYKLHHRYPGAAHFRWASPAS